MLLQVASGLGFVPLELEFLLGHRARLYVNTNVYTSQLADLSAMSEAQVTWAAMPSQIPSPCFFIHVQTIGDHELLKAETAHILEIVLEFLALRDFVSKDL